MNTGLARELRENVGYLRDVGFHSTARLMEAAAAEIERLAAPASSKEQTSAADSPTALVYSFIRRLRVSRVSRRG